MLDHLNYLIKDLIKEPLGQLESQDYGWLPKTGGMQKKKKLIGVCHRRTCQIAKVHYFLHQRKLERVACQGITNGDIHDLERLGDQSPSRWDPEIVRGDRGGGQGNDGGRPTQPNVGWSEASKASECQRKKIIGEEERIQGFTGVEKFSSAFKMVCYYRGSHHGLVVSCFVESTEGSTMVVLAMISLWIGLWLQQ